uniref:Alpha-galactosidase n=1 Tax=Mesocestoides corti TaxID=53468 RepID=A0A5K3G1X0_MESCO
MECLCLHDRIQFHIRIPMRLIGLLACSLLIGLLPTPNDALNNGLALTPPMGWLTWQRYRCQTDCKNYPDDCISEDLIVRQAKHLAADGWLAKGYEYIIIDDCWSMKERHPDTEKLVPDPQRFPKVTPLQLTAADLIDKSSK